MFNSEIVVALIGGLSVAIPTIWANIINNKRNNDLITYQISQLEKKVEKHNNVIERMAIAEQSISSAHKRIDTLVDHMRIEMEE